MLNKLWDDVVAGPPPENGLDKLRRAAATKPLAISTATGGGEASKSMPTTPVTPSSLSSPVTPRGGNVWRSVFNPGSNLATKSIGADIFDRPQPNSPTVYDWYSN